MEKIESNSKNFEVQVPLIVGIVLDASSEFRFFPRGLSRWTGMAMDVDFRFNRVGNEALLVRGMMEPRLFVMAGLIFTTVRNLWVQRHGTHPGDAALVF